MSTSSLASTRRCVLIISLALVGACNGEAPSATTQRAPFIQGASDLVFLAQNANPGAVMEALFVGRSRPIERVVSVSSRTARTPRQSSGPSASASGCKTQTC